MITFKGVADLKRKKRRRRKNVTQQNKINRKPKRRISVPRISVAVILLIYLSNFLIDVIGNIATALTSDNKNEKNKIPKTTLVSIQEYTAPPEYFIEYNESKKATAPQITTTPLPSASYDSNSIKVAYIYQEPELPTGCEITSLTMLLNFLGYDVDKTTLADDYLTMDYTASVGFDKAFIGNPRWDGGYGCFAPVIAETAQKYLNDQNSSYTAKNISGTDFEKLYSYIDQGKPVIVWNSMYQLDVEKYFCYYDENKTPVYWYANEHCVLLTGYDKTENTVTVADPLSGLMKYNTDRFKYLYDTLEKQAVIIE